MAADPSHVHVAGSASVTSPDSFTATLSSAPSSAIRVRHGSSSPAAIGRLAAVVEHEPQRGQRRDGLDRGLELCRHDEQVVDEPGVGHRRQAPPHVGAAQPPRVRLVLHAVADADQPVAAGSARERGQPIGHVIGGQVDPAHDARDGRFGVREREQFGCLGRHRDGLHEHRAVDVVRGEMRGEFVESERPAQRREFGGPWLVAHGEIPDMVMCVDAQLVALESVAWNSSSAGAHHSPSAAVSRGCWHGSVSFHQCRVVSSAAMRAVSAA